MKLSYAISPEDSRDIKNGKIIGLVLAVSGLPGTLFFILDSLINGLTAGAYRFNTALYLLPRISIAIMVIGIALLCLAAYVESALVAEICAASDDGPDAARPALPAIRLKTNRGLLKFILLSLVTFGIYGLVVMSGVSTDINIIATRYDKKKTMNFLLIFFIFTWLTLGIAPLIWSHRLCRRIGNELHRRDISYVFDAGTFWLWNVLGSVIVVGPYVYYHKLFKAMNLLSGDYNTNG